MTNSPLENIKAEQAESVVLLRAAFPQETDEALWQMAIRLRTDRYKRGRYLTPEEIQAKWPHDLVG